MTEITAKLEPRLWRPIDPVAFFAALIAAPLLVTLATFWLLIPIAALVMGGPLYLVVGTPVLLWYLGRHPPDPGAVALVAVAANLAALAIAALLLHATGNRVELEALAWLYGCFGSLFAALWGAVFAGLYQRFQTRIFM